MGDWLAIWAHQAVPGPVRDRPTPGGCWTRARDVGHVTAAPHWLAGRAFSGGERPCQLDLPPVGVLLLLLAGLLRLSILGDPRNLDRAALAPQRRNPWGRQVRWTGGGLG